MMMFIFFRWRKGRAALPCVVVAQLQLMRLTLTFGVGSFSALIVSFKTDGNKIHDALIGAARVDFSSIDAARGGFLSKRRFVEMGIFGCSVPKRLFPERRSNAAETEGPD